MVDYVCEKCGKEFTQNGTYTKHKNKKNHCDSEKMNEKEILIFHLYFHNIFFYEQDC